MKPKKQTVYLLYMEEHDLDRLAAKLVEGSAVNVHDDVFPIWTDIKYGIFEISGTNSIDGYHFSMGPQNEPCLIFTDKQEAIKRAFTDMMGFVKYAHRMHMYDIIRPRIVDEDVILTLEYISDKGDSTLLHWEDVEHLFTWDQRVLLEPLEPDFGTSESDDEKEQFNEIEGPRRPSPVS